MYAPTGTAECIDCPVGSYNDENKQPLCKDCKPGYYTNDLTTILCKNCIGGQYVVESRAIGCDLCSVGYYGDQLKNTAMLIKEWEGNRKGIIVNVEGSLDNNAYAFNNKDLSGDEKTIPQEFLTEPQPNRGPHLKESCIGCDAGLFNNKLGENSSVACKDCPRGTWDAEIGQSVCESCLEGRFSAKLGQTSSDTCLDCGRKARCVDGVCEPNFDPDTGCTVCIGYQVGTFPANFVAANYSKRNKMVRKKQRAPFFLDVWMLATKIDGRQSLFFSCPLNFLTDLYTYFFIASLL